MRQPFYKVAQVLIHAYFFNDEVSEAPSILPSDSKAVKSAARVADMDRVASVPEKVTYAKHALSSPP